MNIIIQSTLKTLQKSEILLDHLSNTQLCDASVPPYSSIGSHIRHILDFYNCIFSVDASHKIDLTARSRDKSVEADCDCAKHYLEQTVEKLKRMAHLDMNATVVATDDLGLGKTDITYTYAALLAQANSHTIHHYAIINFIFDTLGIVIDDPEFGYNPTTPKQVSTK